LALALDSTSADWHLVLSPGEAQRIAIIRLLLHAPTVAVLDEATSALDEAMQGRVMRAVVASGAAVLSVGHRGSLAPWHTVTLNTQDWQ
jgi:putative ATP-binding cassette transporter